MTTAAQLATVATQAEANAKVVWADPSASAQEKDQAVWMAVAARQQADDAERIAA